MANKPLQSPPITIDCSRDCAELCFIARASVHSVRLLSTEFQHLPATALQLEPITSSDKLLLWSRVETTKKWTYGDNSMAEMWYSVRFQILVQDNVMRYEGI